MSLILEENNNQENIENPNNPYVGGFSIIPSHIMDHPDLDDSTKMLFGRLSSLTNRYGYCFASDKYLAEVSKVKTREIQYRLKALKDLDLIRIHSQKNGFVWDRRIYINMTHSNYSKNSYESHQRAPREAPACASKQHQRATYIDKSNNINNNLSVAQRPVVRIGDTIEVKKQEGGTETVTISDVYLRTHSKRKNWKTEEIREAWEVLANYGNIVHDWFRFIEGTIENNRNKLKSKMASTKKERGQHKKQEYFECKTNVAKEQKDFKKTSSEEDSSEPQSQKSPISLGDALKRLQNGLSALPDSCY